MRYRNTRYVPLRRDRDSITDEEARGLGFDYYEEEEGGEGATGFTETGRWGNAGSGLLLTDGERIFLGLRSPYVEEPNTWGIPGGAIPQRPDGSFARTERGNADTEFAEEMGQAPPPYQYVDSVRYEEPGFFYETVIGLVSPRDADSVVPRFNWENVDAGWFTEDELYDLDTHFGLDYVLDNFDPFFGNKEW